MKLYKVRIANFRGYSDPIEIEFENLTAFIGKNDVGKSTILEALDIFFEGKTVKIDSDDGCKNGDPKGVEIACTFSDLPSELVLDTQATTSLQRAHLLNASGQLEIIKKYDCSKKTVSSSVYARAIHPSKEGFDNLLQKKITELRKLVKEHGIECNTSSNPAMREALWASCDDLGLTETLVRLDETGTKEVWEPLQKYLPIYCLFKADRDSNTSDGEVQDPMKVAINLALKEAESEKEQMTSRVQSKAEELVNGTLDVLKEINPESAMGLRAVFASKWDKIFTMDLEDEQGIPINKKGSGLRRQILLSFFQAETRRRQASTETFQPVIYAIEEPETSQHPDMQRTMIRAFLDLSESGSQVILTTHVPALASLIPLESIRFVRRAEKNVQPTIEPGSESIIRAISETLGVLPDLGSKRPKLALVLEGTTDHDAFISISRVLRAGGHFVKINLDDPCETVFKLFGGGGSGLQNWVNRDYIDSLGIPQVHIYDSDKLGSTHPGNEKTVERAQKVNAKPNCVAFVTRRREIDNYLDPAVIGRLTGGAIVLSFGTDEPIQFADMEKKVQTQLLEGLRTGTAGIKLEAVDHRGKKIHPHGKKAKDWITNFLMLNQTADEILSTGAYKDEKGDDQNEIIDWFQAIEKVIVAK